MPENITNPGLIPDPRAEELKNRDYQHAEVAPMAVALNWNRGIEGAPVYSIRDQDGSGSCVAQATAKALEISTGVIQSAHPIYRRRANFDGMGMWLQDAGNIVRSMTGGTTTELLDPSQQMNEQQMNRDITVATPLKGHTYAFPNIKIIDQIAQAIEVRKHSLITFYGTLQEYAYSEKPVVDPLATSMDCPHCICGVYYYTTPQNEKAILIDESWGPNQIRRRTLTESYLLARGTGAMYYIPPAAPVPPVKPHYIFTSDMKYGQESYAIKILQDILKYEGLFDLNVASSGKFFEVTRKGVLAYQKKYAVAPLPEIIKLNGMSAGPKTRKDLNMRYGGI